MTAFVWVIKDGHRSKDPLAVFSSEENAIRAAAEMGLGDQWVAACPLDPSPDQLPYRAPSASVP